VSSTPPIQFSGIASGLDTKAIIDAMMAAETRGVQRMQTKLDQTKERQAALKLIRGDLATLQQKAFDLTLTGKVNSRSAAVGTSSVLSATANALAAKGTFTVNVKQLATATKAASLFAVGEAITSNVALNSGGFGSTVTFTNGGGTTGTFTVNGKTVTISNTTTLDDVVSAINDPGTTYNGAVAQAGIGVTASIELDSDGRANRLRLTSTSSAAIQLGSTGDTTNFLSVARLQGVAAQTVQNTAASSLNLAGVVANDTTVSAIDVSAAKGGDTFTLSYDAATNDLTLTRSSDGAFQTIGIGNLPTGGGTTYSFDTLGVKISLKDVAAGELADDIGAGLAGKTIVTSSVVQSQGNLGSTLPSSALSAARLQTALTATEGDFTINGKTIAWKDNESINTIISRINGAGAGVTASYDSIRDAISLSATATGSQLISLADTTGNFLAATNLTAAAAQTAGQNAIYSIDNVNGGADLSSASNTVSSVVSGVSFTLKQAGSSTVTVDQETTTTVTTAQAFVDQFNQAYDLIKEASKYDATTKTAGVLFGDATARMVGSRLRTLVGGMLVGAAATDQYQSLADIGIAFGKGSTAKLVLDSAKLTKALQNDPDGVEAVFKSFSNTATHVAGGGSVNSITGAPTGHHKAGQYVITSTDNGDGTARLSSVFTPSGGSAETAVRRSVNVGGTNSSLISGIAIKANTPLTSGTDTINVTVEKLGVAYQLNDYLTDLIGVAGVFKKRDDQVNDEIDRINQNIDNFNLRLADRRRTLERQFAALESTLSSLQRQQVSLNGQLSQLQGSK
jgi:flagellar hook-associated protein 2